MCACAELHHGSQLIKSAFQILTRAREVDPHGLRTLGVITKPDQLGNGTDGEKTFLSLARNEQVDFDLGWHVVRNLDSGVSDGTQDRDAIEKQFFVESNFRSLSATTLGIENLRHRLSMVLFDQIKAELPRLIKDIESGISSCSHELDKLGPARVTFDDQKNFLIDLSDEFQKLCDAAVKGDYEHEFFEDRSLADRRLSATIANLGIDFEEDVRTEGAQWKIVEGEVPDKRSRTRAQAIKDVRKLLRISRGREVRVPVPTLDAYTKYTL